MDGSFLSILINWLPMLLLVGVWIYFMRQMRGGRMTPYQKACYDLSERQVIALERIATELAKRTEVAT